MSNSRTYKVSFSRKSDEWETPKELFNQYDAIYHFDLDVSATEQNAKCKRFFTIQDDGLTQKWYGSCWCNPPYSNIVAWVRKAVSEMQNGVTTVMLVPARTDVKWFHDYIYNKPNISIDFVRGRVKFVGGGGKRSVPINDRNVQRSGRASRIGLLFLYCIGMLYGCYRDVKKH